MKGIYILLGGLLLSLANPIGSIAHERYNVLPLQVVTTLDHQYGSFDLIHSTSFYKRGKLRYNLLIQHRRSYVGLTIGGNGRMVNQNRYYKNPLANHYCNNECRFHFQHYRGNEFVSFDPLSGCANHFAIVGRNQGHLQYASLNHPDWYYHPKQKHYKRLKHQKHGYYSHKNRNHKHRSGYFHQKRSEKFQNYGSMDDKYHEHGFSAQHDKQQKYSTGYNKPGDTNRKDRRGNYMYYVDPSDSHARGKGY